MRTGPFLPSVLAIACLLTARQASGDTSPYDFKAAIEAADTERLSRILESEPVFLDQIMPPDGETPLTYAAQKKDLKLVKFLLGRGANPNQKNFMETLPALVAAGEGASQIVDVLLAVGARRDGVDMRERTLFACAAGSKRIEMVQHLIDIGFDPKSPRIVGCAGSEAAIRGDVAMLQFLEKIGVNLAIPNIVGETPLHCAIDSKDTLSWLISRKMDLEKRDDGEMTPLLTACERHQRTGLKMLLDAGAKINVSNLRGETPMSYAIDEKPVDMTYLQFLLDHGEDPNYGRGSDTGTPLHKAIWRRNEAVVDWLLAHKADVNARNADGNNCAHNATWNYPDILPKLVKAGADLNAYNDDGYTPLLWALERNKPQVAQQLRTLGAKELPKGPLNNLVKAIQLGDFASVQRIVNADKSKIAQREAMFGDPPLHIAVAAGRMNIVNFLLENGADLHTTADAGDTLLHTAVHKGQLNMVKLLLSKGLDPNAPDKRGRTPLHVAVFRSNAEMVVALLDAGSNPNIRYDAGLTAIEVAETINPKSPLIPLLQKAATNPPRPSTAPATPR